MKVFISYAREDYSTARKLCDDLREAGADTWLDDDELIPGQDWKAEITKAIKQSGHFIALISTKSVVKRGFVQTELKKALEVLSNIPGKDIFIIPARIDDCGIPDELEHLHCADLFPDYEKGFSKILRAIPGRKQAEPSEPQKPAEVKEPVKEAETPKAKPSETAKPEVKPEAVKASGDVYKLRSEPETLSEDDVSALIKKHNFHCKKYNWTEKWYNESGDFKNDFKDNGDGTITDSVTGLVWEKAGSHHMPFNKAQGYIDGLNKKKFAGFDDWRLPTLEKLASLLENKKVDDFFIDPLFDRKQRWCWTSDKASGGAWNVYFLSGNVNWSNLVSSSYVRGVRSQTIDY